MNIYVDADACPMNDIIIELGLANNLSIYLVKSYNHYSLQEYPTGVDTIYVDTGKEAADYRILSMANDGDLIVSQDYGLAALAIAKNCLVIHPKGFAYNKGNIDQLLASRYQSAQARKQGIRTKGPKALTESDKQKFTSLLTKIITKNIQ
ncbi:uncharacterized protein YaiI (UPF0178 family) [Natronobacillus azotifigens]|uniref:UPF0178 protein OWO01_02000 n=1 Tax=Natronobacillus azotifigens TaxID=472978 RepID=A0A9J6R9F2_9BACI|nr:YaiI/YqxD family protein [Natronobacillus azotifigens]MCZ0701982.1 YaiI/YqxD family protein [Natronobacillus azotifigens]